MTAEILSPFGAAPSPGEVMPEVVEMLEGLLEAAKAGEITGLGYFYVDPAKGVSTCWASGKTPENLMITGASKLAFRVMLATQE